VRYERQHPGLGADFVNAVDAALDLLEQEIVPLTPLTGVAGTRAVKRLMLRRFPYAVIVREADGELFLLAFAHQARRPGYWRNRLRE
jgi:toxin ParE1/3/4